MRKIIYSTLFFAGCVAWALFMLYVFGFFLYLASPNQPVPLPDIAYLPKKFFLLIPLVSFYRKKEVQEVIDFLEKILP